MEEMKTKDIVIIGCSGHAKVVIDIIERQKQYNIVGLIDKDETRLGKEVLGYKIIGTDHNIKALIEKNKIYGGIIAIGDNQKRKEIFIRIKDCNIPFKFVTAIHPEAQIGKDTLIGDGTVIMAGAIVNPSTKIGIQCIINTNASVDHDCSIGDFCHIAPNATIAGNVRIEEETIVGLGANVINNLKIGKNTLIGAGSLVLNDIPDSVVVYGNPAKVIRKKACK